MLLTIAFILFAILMIAWLSMPDSATESLPATEPARADAKPVTAHA